LINTIIPLGLCVGMAGGCLEPRDDSRALARRPVPSAPPPAPVDNDALFPPTVDLSTPKAAAMTYFMAMQYGDVSAARKAVVSDELTLRHIEASASAAGAVRELESVLVARFGKGEVRANQELMQYIRGFRNNAFLLAVADGDVQIDGETAILTPRIRSAGKAAQPTPVPMKKVDGLWKLMLAEMQPVYGRFRREEESIIARDAQSARSLREVAQSVRAGRLSNLDAVWERLSQVQGQVARVQAQARAAETRPATTQASPPPDPARLARLDAIRARLENGENVNAKDPKGHTMLHDAAIRGDEDVVRLLIDSHADVMAKDSQGWTALHWAVSSGHKNVASLLLDSNADVNAAASLQDTPLHWAAIFDHQDAADLLIKHGADVNAKDARGKTPLLAAVEHDARATAELLLSRGANVQDRDEDGATPLHAAVMHAREAMLELHQAEKEGPATRPATVPSTTSESIDEPATRPSAASPQPARPLTRPATESTETRETILARSQEMIDLLLANGAKVNSRTPRGLTPLHLAAWDDIKDLAELLIARGADVNAQDSRGRTPLAFAKQRAQKAVADLLISKGAQE
jgi:ankyrin repeat protein